MKNWSIALIKALHNAVAKPLTNHFPKHETWLYQRTDLLKLTIGCQKSSVLTWMSPGTNLDGRRQRHKRPDSSQRGPSFLLGSLCWVAILYSCRFPVQWRLHSKLALRAQKFSDSPTRYISVHVDRMRCCQYARTYLHKRKSEVNIKAEIHRFRLDPFLCVQPKTNIALWLVCD